MKNTTADYTDIQIINWDRYKTNTQGTPLFLDKRPRKNQTRKNWCNSSEGFLLLSSSYEYNSGCPLGYPVTEIKYTGRNLSEITSLHLAIPLWSSNYTNYPRLQLHFPFALAAWACVELSKTLHQLCTASSASWSSDFSVLGWSCCSSAEFRLLQGGSSFPCVKQCMGPAGPMSASLVCAASSSLSLPLSVVYSGSRRRSSNPNYPCPSVATQITTLIFSANHAPEKLNLFDHLEYLQLTLKPPLILFMLMNQRPKLSP